jgi:hypothetical protein
MKRGQVWLADVGRKPQHRLTKRLGAVHGDTLDDISEGIATASGCGT